MINCNNLIKANNCPGGTYLDKNCIFCPPGTQLSYGNSCKNCSRGYYSQGLGICYKCPEGSISTEGSSKCTKCPAGTFDSNYNKQCQKCSKNFTSSRGSSICYEEGSKPTSCSPGNYFISKKCLKCPKGAFCKGGLSSYSKCPYGTYSLEGSSECKKCPAGTITSKNQDKCLNCSAGYYSLWGKS